MTVRKIVATTCVLLVSLATSASAGVIDTQITTVNHALGTPVTVENGDLYNPGAYPPAFLTNGALTDQIHGDVAGNLSAGFGYLVDLGATPAFDSIDVISRSGTCCPERLSNFQVTLHEDDGGSAGGELWNSGALFVGSNPGNSARVSLAEGDGAARSPAADSYASHRYELRRSATTCKSPKSKF